MKEKNERDIESARVNNGQGMLIPVSPRELCESIGLHWWAALKLWDDKCLSFDPIVTPQLDEAQETEVVFLGSLVAAGCDPAFLNHLLEGLHKPYSYRIRQIYFDWSTRQWHPLPIPEPLEEREKVFSDWVEELKSDKDLDKLKQLSSEIDAAIRDCSMPNTSEL